MITSIRKLIIMNHAVNNKKAVTLAEILLACVLMAGAFLPIIGLMSNSIKITEQDENTQRAAKLCQEKLDMALQMPYNTFSVGTTYDGSQTIPRSNDVELILGTEPFDNVDYTSTLKVDNQPIDFTVPTCDFEIKARDQENDPEHKGNNPDSWDFKPVTYRVTDRIKRYTVTVKWRDKGRDNEKEYTLTCLKADIR